jgi:hypothetical protein
MFPAYHKPLIFGKGFNCMILLYGNVKNRPSGILSLTGLTKAEFEFLLPLFEKAEEEYVRETYINGKERKRSPGGGRRPKLRTARDRLFFILFYLKTYPLQEVAAVLFGMSLSQTNFWIHRLSAVLKRALRGGAYLPERDPAASEEALKKCSGLSFVIDGTEREIQRPEDPEKQKIFYSGRKKNHTVKNIVISDACSKKVIYLSGTYEGKKHDKKIPDEENPAFPAGSTVFKDTGFQGYEPGNTVCHQPEKKPRGKELPAEDKIFNKMISGVRVIAEHVFSGVKRLRIVKDVLRNTKKGFADLVMETACGLHNLRVTLRVPKHPKKDPEPLWH